MLIDNSLTLVDLGVVNRVELDQGHVELGLADTETSFLSRSIAGFLPMRVLVMLAVLALAYGLGVPTGFAQDLEPRARYVEGVGGVPLNVVEAGERGRPAVVFIHGLGQSHLSWMLQLRSTLAQRFHLVAFDLRGHGNSGKPWRGEDYDAPRVWAGDLERVIRATIGEQQPLLVAWSYGTWVAVDYLATHEPGSIAGLMMIGAYGGLAPIVRSTRPVDAELAKRISTLTSSGLLEDNFAAGEAIGPFFMRRPVDAAWMQRTGATNALLPPYARPLITSRSFEHGDKIDRIRMPTRFVVGSEDVQVSPAGAQALAARLPSASVSVYEGSGHLPFAEERERFNDELEVFAGQVFGREGR